jgi:SRSO17 transposase
VSTEFFRLLLQPGISGVEFPATPAKYWLSTLSPETKLTDLVKMAKHRWVI